MQKTMPQLLRKRARCAVFVGLGASILIGLHPAAAQQPAKVTVRNSAELQKAVARATAGTRIELSSGDYVGGLTFSNVRGEPDKPIVIAAADAARPPVFKGRNEGLHFSNVAHLELHNLTIQGGNYNGLNIDDGGNFTKPSHHIVLRGLHVKNVGRGGNQDGIKLSGITDFRVENCVVEFWGLKGSAIDMVGCHRGVIVGNAFRHDPKLEDAQGSGVQTKGGTSDVTVRGNRFEHARGRAVNIGGSTDLDVFRPPINQWKGKEFYEAKDIVVEGNTFIGSSAPIAFVGVDGATVRFNTFYRPRRWVIRILRETTAEGFVPTRNGVFSDNIIAFRSTEWKEGGVNVGPNTAPDTFRFERNFWFCLDKPALSAPRLPTKERDGVRGQDPKFRDAEKDDLRLSDDSPAKKFGAEALEKKE